MPRPLAGCSETLKRFNEALQRFIKALSNWTRLRFWDMTTLGEGNFLQVHHSLATGHGIAKNSCDVNTVWPRRVLTRVLAVANIHALRHNYCSAVGFAMQLDQFVHMMSNSNMIDSSTKTNNMSIEMITCIRSDCFHSSADILQSAPLMPRVQMQTPFLQSPLKLQSASVAVHTHISHT